MELKFLDFLLKFLLNLKHFEWFLILFVLEVIDQFILIFDFFLDVKTFSFHFSFFLLNSSRLCSEFSDKEFKCLDSCRERKFDLC